MINPQHECRYTRGHETELHYLDGRFSSIGVSLHVLLQAFFELPAIWYAGDYLDHTLILAIDPSKGDGLDRKPFLHGGPVQRAASDEFRVQEFQLTEELKSQLGICLDEKGIQIDRSETVLHQFLIHDDCYASIWPVDPSLLRKVVKNILRLHSYYLGTEVYWLNVLDEIATAVLKLNTLHLVSDPERETLDLYRRETRRSFLGRIHTGRRLFRRIEIQYGRATFRE